MPVDNLLCPICAQPFENSEDIRNTSCGHVFHLWCMRQIESNHCPECNDFKPTTDKLSLCFNENDYKCNELIDKIYALNNELETLKIKYYKENKKSVHYRIESENEIYDLKKLLTTLKERIVCLESMASKQRQQILKLNEELSNLEMSSETTIAELNKENDILKRDLENMSIELALKESSYEKPFDQQAQCISTTGNMISNGNETKIPNMYFKTIEDVLKFFKTVSSYMHQESHTIISDSLSEPIQHNENSTNTIEPETYHTSSVCTNEIRNALQIENNLNPICNYQATTYLDPKKDLNSINNKFQVMSKGQLPMDKLSNGNDIEEEMLYANLSSEPENGVKEIPDTNPLSESESIHTDDKPNYRYLDFLNSKMVDHFKTSNEFTGNSVVIQNYPFKKLQYPLENAVRAFVDEMNISIRKNDVDTVIAMAQSYDLAMISIFVRFKTMNSKKQFLKNITSFGGIFETITVKRYIEEDVVKLYLYARKKLPRIGYTDIFWANNKVYARNGSTTHFKRIFTRKHVDYILKSVVASKEYIHR